MLSLREELFLFAIDDTTGRFHAMPERALDIGLAAAAIMGLHNRKRLRVDPPHLAVEDTTPTEDPVLDEVLTKIAAYTGETLHENIRWVAGHAHHIREATIKGLAEKGIIRCEEEKILWLVPFRRRYPVADNKEEVLVKEQMRKVLLEGAAPDPWDIDIITLADACDLMYTILSAEELKSARPMINKIKAMDPIGLAMSETMASVQHTFHEVVAHGML